MAVTRRKADQVADDLLHRIVSGELDVGSILPREDELAARYGVNRGVIREAIKLLEVHRLVRPQRRRGTEVLDPLASLSPEVLKAMLMPSPGRVEPTMLAELLELRASLDEDLTALAAERRTEDDLRELEIRLQELREALDDAPRYAAAMQRLGLTMARATQNRIYLMFVHWHGRVMADAGEVMLEARAPSEAHLQGLELLVELVRARDVEGARALVRTFHAYATPMLLERAEALAREATGVASSSG
jgi:DNA-binding FadR family transcriptional regulator